MVTPVLLSLWDFYSGSCSFPLASYRHLGKAHLRSSPPGLSSAERRRPYPSKPIRLSELAFSLILSPPAVTLTLILPQPFPGKSVLHPGSCAELCGLRNITFCD
jgi:hypothetical protein